MALAVAEPPSVKMCIIHLMTAKRQRERHREREKDVEVKRLLARGA